MKKLTKIAVLLATAIAFTACSSPSGDSNNSGDSNGSGNNNKETINSELTQKPLLTDAEIVELTEDASLFDISDGTWLLQEYYTSDSPEAGIGMGKKEYEKILAALTDAEKAQVESWLYTSPKNQSEDSVQINIPYASLCSIDTFKVSVDNAKISIKSGTMVEIYTITDENAVIKKLESYINWNGNTGMYSHEVKENKYSKYEREFEEDLPDSWKTNAEKDKFVVSIGENCKYFFVKQ